MSKKNKFIIGEINYKGRNYEDLIIIPNDIPEFTEEETTPLDFSLDFDYLYSTPYPVNYNYGVVYNQLQDDLIVHDIRNKKIFVYKTETITRYNNATSGISNGGTKFNFLYGTVSYDYPPQTVVNIAHPIEKIINIPNVTTTIVKDVGSYQNINVIIKTYSELDRTYKNELYFKLNKLGGLVSYRYNNIKYTPIVNNSVIVGNEYNVSSFVITNNTPTIETSTHIKEIIINSSSSDVVIDETSVLHDELYKANTRYSIAYNVFGEENVGNSQYSNQLQGNVNFVLLNNSTIATKYNNSLLKTNNELENISYNPRHENYSIHRPMTEIFHQSNIKTTSVITKLKGVSDINSISADEIANYYLNSAGLNHQTLGNNHLLYQLDFTKDLFINVAYLIGLKNANNLTAEMKTKLLAETEKLKAEFNKNGVIYSPERYALVSKEAMNSPTLVIN